jgi:hypothetical protein
MFLSSRESRVESYNKFIPGPLLGAVSGGSTPALRAPWRPATASRLRARESPGSAAARHGHRPRRSPPPTACPRAKTHAAVPRNTQIAAAHGSSLRQNARAAAKRCSFRGKKKKRVRRPRCYSCSWAEMGHCVRGLPNPFAEGRGWISSVRFGWLAAEQRQNERLQRIWFL